MSLRIKITPELGSLISFLCIFIFFGVFAPRFLTIESIGSMLNMAVELGIVVVGVTLLMTGGEFDLSVGSVFALGSFIFVSAISNGVNPYLAFVFVILSGIMIGLLNGLITVKTGIPSFLTTLGTMLFWRGVMLGLSGGQTIPFQIKSRLIENAGGRFVDPFLNSVWIFLVTVLIFHLIFEHSRYGNWLRASGGNKIVGELMGLPVNKTKIQAFIVCSVLASFAGFLDACRLKTFNPLLGQGMELEAIAASVLGGTSLFGGYGTLIGSLFGVLIISALRVGLVMMGMTVYIYFSLVGVILIAAILIKHRFSVKFIKGA